MSRTQSSSTSPRRLIVTGGARGLGHAISAKAEDAGYEVVVLDQLPYTHCSAITVDLSDPHAAQAAASAAVEQLGGLDALVLCAGVNRPERFGLQEFDTWKSVIDVNLIGNAAVARASLDALKADGGRVVGIGSTASRRLTPGMSAYGTSKHAFTAFLHSLALEENGVLPVSIVHPGLMDTQFFEGRKPQYRPPISEKLSPDPVADAVMFCLQQPANVAIRDLFITDVSVYDWP